MLGFLLKQPPPPRGSIRNLLIVDGFEKAKVDVALSLRCWAFLRAEGTPPSSGGGGCPAQQQWAGNPKLVYCVFFMRHRSAQQQWEGAQFCGDFLDCVGGVLDGSAGIRESFSPFCSAMGWPRAPPQPLLCRHRRHPQSEDPRGACEGVIPPPTFYSCVFSLPGVYFTETKVASSIDRACIR